MTSTPRVLVTRPEPQASEWAQALRQEGLRAEALPLLSTTPPPDAAAVTALWQGLADRHMLVFVSPAAASWFFRQRPAAAHWPEGLDAAAPGPGTAAVVRNEAHAALGLALDVVSPSAEAEQFDSEHLWPLLAGRPWAGRRVVFVSGGDALGPGGRTWLIEQLQAHGAAVDVVQAYARGPGQWTPSQQACAREALAQPNNHVWLLSSSQALDALLDDHLPGLEVKEATRTLPHGLCLLCTHPRIASHARQRLAQVSGLRLLQCRPRLADVVAVVRQRRSLG